MKLFDLHCDTLYRALDERKNICENDFHISLKKGMKYDLWAQCFAVWIPDEMRKDKALTLFKRAYEKLLGECKKSELIIICKDENDIERAAKEGKCAVLFTVEGSAALAGKIENLEYFKKCGVRMITTTWNGSCEFGDGAGVEAPKGITEFGKQVVIKMNELDIVIDVSHASDPLFFDVAEVTKKPIVASHSNSREVCGHKRNLTDEQFNVIKSKDGLVGLNFSRGFLNEKDADSATMLDIIKHAEHFLSLGGEKNICIGSDFDGTDIPKEMSGIESMGELYNLFLQQGYSESLVEGIFFNNAYRFFDVGYKQLC